jgi:hypothetical protein
MVSHMEGRSRLCVDGHRIVSSRALALRQTYLMGESVGLSRGPQAIRIRTLVCASARSGAGIGQSICVRPLPSESADARLGVLLFLMARDILLLGDAVSMRETLIRLGLRNHQAAGHEQETRNSRDRVRFLPMARKDDLPNELKTPIRLDRIVSDARKSGPPGSGQTGKILAAEIRRRAALMAQHLGMSWPENERDWLKLLVAICSRWKVPGFELAVTGPGAHKKWTLRKNIQLLNDIDSLRKKNKRLSDYAACRYIASHPDKYENRYPRNLDTLHRQFLRAKAEHELSSLVDGLERDQDVLPKCVVTHYSDLLKMRNKKQN